MKSTIKFFTFFILTVSTLHADLKTDLTNINSSIRELNSNVNDLNLTAETLCAPLIAIHQQAREIIDSITATNTALTPPLVLDNDTLLLTENLYLNVTALSSASSMLSTGLAQLQ